VISSALESLNNIDEDAALAKAIDLKQEKTSKLVGAVSEVLAASGDKAHLPYFEDKLTTVSLFSVFKFYGAYQQLVASLPPAEILTKSARLSEIGQSPVANIFYRFAATNMLDQLRGVVRSSDADVAQQITAMIEQIKEKETNPMLAQRYQSY